MKKLAKSKETIENVALLPKLFVNQLVITVVICYLSSSHLLVYQDSENNVSTQHSNHVKGRHQRHLPFVLACQIKLVNDCNDFIDSFLFHNKVNYECTSVTIVDWKMEVS